LYLLIITKVNPGPTRFFGNPYYLRIYLYIAIRCYAAKEDAAPLANGSIIVRSKGPYPDVSGYHEVFAGMKMALR
jgi:hypothetical protein